MDTSEDAKQEADSGMLRALCAQYDAQHTDYTTRHAELLKLLPLYMHATTAEQQQEHRRVIAGLLIHLRGLNRALSQLREQARAAIDANKVTLDEANLAQHSYLYETSHLKQQITSQNSIGSTYKQLQLISEEAFLAQQGNEDLNASHTHEITMGRLEHEISTRKQLFQQVESLQQTYEAVAATHAAAQTHYDSLTGQLAQVYETARTVGEKLFTNPDGVFEPVPAWLPVNQQVQALPVPLANLFQSATAFRHSFQFARDVLIRIQKNGEASRSQKRDPAHATHELMVTVQIPGEHGSTCILEFRYLPSLDLVTVHSLVSSEIDVEPELASNMLKPLLVDLFPGFWDEGTRKSFPRSVKLNKTQAADWPAGDIGRPYRWAQLLCGLTGHEYSSAEYANVSFGVWLSAFRKRLQAKETMLQALRDLGNLQLPAACASEGLDLKVSAFQLSDMKMFNSCLTARHDSLHLRVSRLDTFCQVTLVCSQWKVTAHLAVFNSHASKSNAVLLELAAAHADTPPSVSEQTLKSVEAMLNNTHGLPQQLTVLAKGLDNSM